MLRTRSLVRVLVVSATAAIVGLAGAPLASADAGHTVTSTLIKHSTFTDNQATSPCTGAVGVATVDLNSVDHVTYFPASGEVWATFTLTAKVTAVWSGVTYAGHATEWGNVNLNEKNMNTTFTFSLRLIGSDGSTIVAHQVAHLTLNANGVVTSTFDKPRLSCT